MMASFGPGDAESVGVELESLLCHLVAVVSHPVI